MTFKYQHACESWDGLDINESSPEFDKCLCFRRTWTNDDLKDCQRIEDGKLILDANPCYYSMCVDCNQECNTPFFVLFTADGKDVYGRKCIECHKKQWLSNI